MSDDQLLFLKRFVYQHYNIMESKGLVLKKQWFINDKPGQITNYYDLEQKALGSGAFGTVMKGRLKGQTS